MTRRLNASLTGGLGVLALASAMGCEAQVNDEYKGEPLFSLQGNVVVSEEQADSKLIPHLAFRVAGEEANSVVLVDGELTGEFPAKFRFDVTEPPPDSVLSGPFPEMGLSGKGAVGFLVLRPANDKSPILSHIDSETTYECTDDGSSCTAFEVGCLDDGRCRERTLECTERPCDLVDQWGDSNLRETVAAGSPGYVQTTTRCDSEFCYSITTTCDDDQVCFQDVYRCDFAEYDEHLEGVEEGVMTTCHVKSESGDSTLLELDDLDTVASEYLVIYLTEDSPYFDLPLERGYNLVWLNTNDAWLESEKCQIDTFAALLAEYNQEHQTDHTPGSEAPEVEELAEAAEKKCSPVKVIEQPLSQDLTIELGGGLPPAF